MTEEYEDTKLSIWKEGEGGKRSRVGRKVRRRKSTKVTSMNRRVDLILDFAILIEVTWRVSENAQPYTPRYCFSYAGIYGGDGIPMMNCTMAAEYLATLDDHFQ